MPGQVLMFMCHGVRPKMPVDLARSHLISKLAELLEGIPRKDTLVCEDAINNGRLYHRLCYLLTDEEWDAGAKLADQLAKLHKRRRVKVYEVRRDPHFGYLMLVLLTFLT